MSRKLIKKIFTTLAIVSIMTITAPFSVRAAGITVYRDGDKYIKLGGRTHLQYHRKNPSGKDSTDKVFFRRLRFYIEGSLHKDWKGKFQWDMGEADDDNELEIKDVYLQYKGIKNIKLTIGNANFPFSRAKLTSSNKQQLVERTFVGDHNYGTPDRNAGVQVSGGLFADDKVTYGLALASSSIDPDADKLDFDTPMNKHNDFNEGWIVGGRVDFHPFGKLGFSQGDFRKDLKATVSIASFAWKNDNDNNTYTDNGTDTGNEQKPDVDSVIGLEFSGAIRFLGFSLDTEYNLFDADTVDNTVTKGIYKNGSTTLKNFAVEGGYMVIPKKMELVAAYHFQDADNYAKRWTRTSVGVNWFLKKHDIKLQFTYRIGKNLKGVKESDEDELFLKMQYLF